MPALATLADVKAWLDIADENTADDALLTRLITRVSGIVEAWLSRSILAADYTQEFQSQYPQKAIAIKHYPINSVASVSIAGVEVPYQASDPNGNGYRWDQGEDSPLIYLKGYSALGRVVVTYNGGYATAPDAIQQAVIELVAIRYKERSRIGQQTMSIHGESATFTVEEIPRVVRMTLQQFKRVGLP